MNKILPLAVAMGMLAVPCAQSATETAATTSFDNAGYSTHFSNFLLLKPNGSLPINSVVNTNSWHRYCTSK